MTRPEHLRQDLLTLIPERPALVAFDFDGVMTDDRVYVSEDGKEMVACTRGDGLGVTMLRRAGIPVAILSTEKNAVVAARARKLQVECFQGIPDKTAELRRLIGERKIAARDVIFVGNDVNDLGCLRISGCGLVVADAHPLARKAAKGVLSNPGGRYAVREVAELVLTKLGAEIVYNPSDAGRGA